MASEIVSGSLDAEYPVAGIDNDTQGFRDNFSIIKTGLSTAAAEISQLQGNTARLDQSNDFNGSQISDAELAEITEKTYASGILEAGVEVQFANGHYQTFTIGPGAAPTVTFDLVGWPQREGYAKITVAFKGTGTGTAERNILITSPNSSSIKKSENYPVTVTVDIGTADPVIIEFWTANQGNTVYANYLGKFTE
jgi:hypothetical protein